MEDCHVSVLGVYRLGYCMSILLGRGMMRAFAVLAVESLLEVLL